MAYAFFDTPAIHAIPGIPAIKEPAQAGGERGPSLVIAAARLPKWMAGAATEPLPLGGVPEGVDGPFGRLFLQSLAMVAEFEANLGHLRTREGMTLAKRQAKLKGKQPRLPESA